MPLLKRLGTMGLMMCCLSSAYAGFYMGPLVSYESIRAGDVSYLGWTPRLTAGYGDYIRNAVYLAGELQAGAVSINHQNNPNNVGGLETSYSYSASVLPGVSLDRIILLYGRAGIIQTHFKNLNTTRRGTQLGLGLQAELTPKWSIRGEYDYVKYVFINGIGNPTADQYGIGLVYKWS